MPTAQSPLDLVRRAFHILGQTKYETRLLVKEVVEILSCKVAKLDGCKVGYCASPSGGQSRASQLYNHPTL